MVLYCDKERKVMEARFLSFSHYTPPFLVLCAVMCGVKRGACVSLPRSLHFQHTTEQEQAIHLFLSACFTLPSHFHCKQAEIKSGMVVCWWVRSSCCVSFSIKFTLTFHSFFLPLHCNLIEIKHTSSSHSHSTTFQRLQQLEKRI